MAVAYLVLFLGPGPLQGSLQSTLKAFFIWATEVQAPLGNSGDDLPQQAALGLAGKGMNLAFILSNAALTPFSSFYL